MSLQKYVPVVARTFLTVIFLRSGTSKIFGFAGTVEQLAGQGVPLPAVTLAVSICLEVLGALSVILGFKARWGAIALIVFLVPTTLIFHTDFSIPGEGNQFFKNLGLIGGLLLVSVWGAGPVSIDAALGEPASRSERLPE